MKKITRARRKTTKDQKSIKEAINFLEELSWLLSSKKGTDLEQASEALRNYIQSPIKTESIADKSSLKPNIHYLIGILPSLFQNKQLFSRNDDIANFASQALGLNIRRIEKRSQYELIGLIVCETSALDDEELSDLVNSLSIILGDTEKMSIIANDKSKVGFSWNEAIRKLSK